MCVVSMVYDHFRPQFEPYENTRPLTDPNNFRELVEKFRKAAEAAQRVDSLTNQPDCEDPEKAKLLERVAELERRLAPDGEDHFSRAFPGERRSE